MIRADEVYAVIPVLEPASTEEVACRVYLRFDHEDHDSAREIIGWVARELSRLKVAGRIEGSASGWRRRCS